MFNLLFSRSQHRKPADQVAVIRTEKPNRSKTKKVRVREHEDTTKIRKRCIRARTMLRDVRQFWSIICELYVAFCSETTIHGLKHTVRKNHHFIERIIWLGLVCAAFYGACACGLSHLARYNDEPLVVSMKRDYRRWWSSFPAVTACVVNRMDEDAAQELIERQWNVTFEQDPEKYQYYRSLVELVSDVSFRSNIQSFWKYQNDVSVVNISLLDIATDVHPLFKLKVTVPNGQSAVWVPVITEMGLCKTFNSAYATYQFASADKLEHTPLFKCHFNSLQCFVKIESVNVPVRFFVHSPYDIPDAVSNPVGALEPGAEAVLDFTLLEMQAGPSVRALHLDQRKCRYPDEVLSAKIQAYSYGLCQMHCRTKMAIMFCGCRPFFHIRGEGAVCDAHGMACIGRNAEILINLPKNLARCSCLPQCTELNYYSHSTKLLIRNETETDENGDRVVALRLNLKPPKFRLHRDVIFSFQDLLASLGGTMALFVGASVLTLFEIMFFVYLALVKLMSFVYRRLRRGRRQLVVSYAT